ncbi:hypothetical protein [Faecalispora sporosphaeroides]|uniref:hypothetical protein n=1 Tax=Faecalispora sporosphaeroides TaxID=1549 RepID=UPI00036334F0|nr:hypothetical protein [Faecalispora sporosphaeroides]
MEIDAWIGGYKVRSFPWIDGKTIYFNVQYYRTGQSLSQPPVWSKTVYITNDVAGRDMVENLAASLTEHVANMEIPVGRKIVLTAERSLKI